MFASNRLTNQRFSILLFLERTCRRQRLETTSTTILSHKKKKISASENLSKDGIGFHQNKINVNIAMITQWLKRWTWNPMGTSRARSSPARSLWSHFQIYIQKLGTRTNTCVRKQLRLTNQRFSILLFLERTCRRQRLETTSTTILSQKKRRLAQAKICPRTESDSIKTRLMSL